jgi:non-canonical purine NTP pyrophosphatase (RdgB/HAM1 family)
MKVVFITGNENKARQVQEWLGVEVEHVKLELEEMQTLNLEELVRHKARQAFQVLQSAVLVEDTALEFGAMGRLPGPFVKYFEKELGLERMCRMLDGYEDRSAKAVAVFGLCKDGDNVEIFRGEVTGRILENPVRIENSFGWNPIFVPEEAEKCLGQMSLEEMRPYSHRWRALEKLQKAVLGE